jgi:transposase InsO family protein
MLLHREKLLKEIDAKKRTATEVAEILGVERETVSRWLAKYRFEGLDGICPKKPGPKIGSVAVNRTPEELEELVCEYAKWDIFKGPQVIADLLEEREGIEMHKTTVWRILKRKGVRYGLHYKYLKKKRQLYCLGEPGDEVQMDVTFPFGRARDARVFDAIDDCSRLVFGKVFDGHSQKESIAFVNELILAMPFTIKAVRTDCGSEFGKEFTEHLAKLGIAHRRNPPYTPQHNGKIERYHRTFKEREAYSWPFHSTLDELNYKLRLWLYEYNFKKKHSGLQMHRLTPAQKILHASFYKPMQPHLKSVTGTLQLNSTLQKNKHCRIHRRG